MTDQRLTSDRTRPSAPSTGTDLRRFLRRPRALIRSNLRAYLAMNLIAYGLFAVGVIIALLSPDQTAARAAARDASGFTDLIASLLATPAMFALVIFAVNTLATGLVQIILPSLIIPFAGIAVFGCRAVMIGLDMVPTTQTAAIALIPHSLTLLIEFQAYVLLMLGVYLLARAWISPERVGARTRRRAYLIGLRDLARLSVPAALLLVIGALYEALSLAYLVPVLLRAWT